MKASSVISFGIVGLVLLACFYQIPYIVAAYHVFAWFVICLGAIIYPVTFWGMEAGTLTPPDKDDNSVLDKFVQSITHTFALLFAFAIGWYWVVGGLTALRFMDNVYKKQLAEYLGNLKVK